MCLALAPAALAGISTAVSVGSSALGYLGQRRAAAEQDSYNQSVYTQQQQQAVDQANFQNRQVSQQNEYILQNRENAAAALGLDRTAMVEQEYQEGIAASLEAEQARIQALQGLGSLQASGKTGNTLAILMGDFYKQEAQFRNTTANNLAFASGQRVREMQKLATTAQSRVNEARPYESAPIQTPYAPVTSAKPSGFGALLGVGGAALGSYNQYSTYDSLNNRYRIGSARMPSSGASSLAPRRNYSTGLAPLPFQQNKTNGKN